MLTPSLIKDIAAQTGTHDAVVVEPVRNLNEGTDNMGTRYEICPVNEADTFAVYVRLKGTDEIELVEDYVSLDEARTDALVLSRASGMPLVDNTATSEPARQAAHAPSAFMPTDEIVAQIMEHFPISFSQIVLRQYSVPTTGTDATDDQTKEALHTMVEIVLMHAPCLAVPTEDTLNEVSLHTHLLLLSDFVSQNTGAGALALARNAVNWQTAVVQSFGAV